MKWISRCRLIGITAGMLSGFLFTPNSLAQDPNAQKYKRSDVDIPISLAIGTVRTPEFTVKNEAYFIMIQIEKPVNPKTPEELLLSHQRECMMGIAGNILDCSRDHLLLRADWTVWEGERIVKQGSDPDHPAGMFE